MALRDSIIDPELNIEFNRERWGDRETWIERDRYGYKWGDGYQQNIGDVSRLADQMLRPYLHNRYDHIILELSPGAGRFTAELIRYAKRLDLLDMNKICLDICQERFKYYPVEINYFLNDGRDCGVLEDRLYSLIACYDSMVHMHPEIIAGYVRQLAGHLEDQGIMWLDHSGRGAADSGHRTDMTADRMVEIGQSCGLKFQAQRFRNAHDCITVMVFRKDKNDNK